MKIRDVVINVCITLTVLFLKDYIITKLNKKERPQIIVYNNSRWKNKNMV